MQESLISLLAETDAIFQPIRSWKNTSQISAILDQRQDFHRCGLPLPKTATDDGDRKHVERERDALEQSGSVRFHRTNGRRSHWKLSDTGDWFLRRLATWSDFDAAVTVLVAVDSLTDNHHTNAGNVPDWAVALAPGNDGQNKKAREAVAHVAELAAPALCRGWLTAWSDVHGANGFHITIAGKKFLAKPEAPGIDWPDYDDKANGVYLQARDAARKNLAAMKPATGGPVAIPLGSGDWPSDETRLGQPSVFDSRGKVRTPAAMTRAILRSLEAKA